MISNRIMWVLVSLVVSTTIVISFGTSTARSQQDTSRKQSKSPFGDVSKYPIADYDAPEPITLAERDERKKKSTRYDKKLLVVKNPGPKDVAAIAAHGDPMPPNIPFAQSSLIIIGEVLNSGASLSNDKSGVYSEYSVRIETVLKGDEQKPVQASESVTVDRTGGRVRYPNGQIILYRNSWQDLPELNQRYLFFLENSDGQSPNYRILTAYQLKNGNVAALDMHSRFREFNGMSEASFINLVLSRK